jgi:hypothetical protein
VSGTPQHFAGVGARARIVAINNNAEAPIFGFAETGAVADARHLLPLIADALEHMQGNDPSSPGGSGDQCPSLAKAEAADRKT